LYPQRASELISLKNNKNAHAKHLAALIHKGSSLTAQIIPYAKSAFLTIKVSQTGPRTSLSLPRLDELMNRATH
jgi:hypothetical protein